jgi:hypothetical protein
VKRAFALLPLGLLLAVAPGCGSSGATELDPVASAASKTSDAGSSRVAFELTMTAAGEEMSFSGEGISAYDELRGAMTMDMSSVAPGSGDATMEVRMVDGMMYMRMPAALAGEAQLPEGKDWIGFDIEKALDAAGLGGMSPAQLQQDPSQTLRLLRASSTNVEEVGEADVRGVDTTRYTATLDLEQALQVTSGELGLNEKERRELRAAAKELKKQAGVDAIPVDVFVDDDGLLRRMTMKMKMTIEGERVSMEMAYDYYDFGVDVDVEAPPASRVLDVTEEIPSDAGQG